MRRGQAGTGASSYSIFNFRGIIRGRNFFREYGPVVIPPSGVRFWGVGTAGDGIDDRPPAGPWIEYADGSVCFIEAGQMFWRSPDHDSTVALRTAGRQFVEAALGSNPVAWFAESSFLPFVNSSRNFEGVWESADMEARRLYSGWAVEQWDRAQGNLSHEEERQIEPWLERFRQTVNEEREKKFGCGVKTWRDTWALPYGDWKPFRNQN